MNCDLKIKSKCGFITQSQVFVSFWLSFRSYCIIVSLFSQLLFQSNRTTFKPRLWWYILDSKQQTASHRTADRKKVCQSVLTARNSSVLPLCWSRSWYSGLHLSSRWVWPTDWFTCRPPSVSVFSPARWLYCPQLWWAPSHSAMLCRHSRGLHLSLSEQRGSSENIFNTDCFTAFSVFIIHWMMESVVTCFHLAQQHLTHDNAIKSISTASVMMSHKHYHHIFYTLDSVHRITVYILYILSVCFSRAFQRLVKGAVSLTFGVL